MRRVERIGLDIGHHQIHSYCGRTSGEFQAETEPAPVPHGSTALGRADLAARSPDVFDQLLASLEHDMEPTLWPRIRAGIVRARGVFQRYGFCFSMGDWNPDGFAVGVPMMSGDISRVLAFNVSGRVSVMTHKKLIYDVGPKLVALRNSVFKLTEGRF